LSNTSRKKKIEHVSLNASYRRGESVRMLRDFLRKPDRKSETRRKVGWMDGQSVHLHASVIPPVSPPIKPC
jgi:hypothetical protein